MFQFFLVFTLLPYLFELSVAVPCLGKRQAASASATASNPAISAGVSFSSSSFYWSPSQRIDVTGPHAYAKPLPGQARGPCPAQNALANHGYLDRSGYITFLDCVTANRLVFSLADDFVGILYFQG